MQTAILSRFSPRYFPTRLLLLTLCAGLSACVGESDAQSPPLPSGAVALESGTDTRGGIQTSKQTKVISTQQDYAAELARYSNETPQQLDFDSGRVLLVDMGSRPSGGYAIGVSSLDTAEDWVVANVTLVKPGPDCFVTQALTNPYQFVYIPTLNEILVSESVEIDAC